MGGSRVRGSPNKKTFTIQLKNTPESYYEESKYTPKQKGDQMEAALIIVFVLAIGILAMNLFFKE
jgi:hypothetical protein